MTVINQEMQNLLTGNRNPKVPWGTKSETPGQRERRERAEEATRAEEAGVSVEQLRRDAAESRRARRQEDADNLPTPTSDSLETRLRRLNRESGMAPTPRELAERFEGDTPTEG